MNFYGTYMGGNPESYILHGWPYVRPLAAFADGPVADTAEPVAAEAGRTIPEPDGNHSDTVTHKQ